MKKVLILSYFFPPANFAGSYRVASWTKYLHKFGWYPIIITRQWNEGQSDLTDKVLNNELVIEINEFYEVHKIPYNQNLRDRIHQKYGTKKYNLLRKTLSLLEIIIQNFTILITSYRNIYYYTENYLKENTDIEILLVSGRPFQLFKFADKLSKQFNLRWIADYRDEWSTSQWKSTFKLGESIAFYLDKRSELSWVRSSTVIVSCSAFLAQSIAWFNKKMGYNILNGFEPNDYITDVDNNKSKDKFNVVYNGTLYSTQQIEVFIDACKQIWDDNKNKIALNLIFQGIKSDPIQLMRVEKLISGYEKYVTLGSRISKKEVIEIQKSADLLLMLSHKNVLGNYSSKIFEYLACRVPILLVPSDGDVMEQLIMETNSGFIANDTLDIFNKLNEFITLKERGLTIPYNPNLEEFLKYTRENQVGKLAEVLNKAIKIPSVPSENGFKFRHKLFSLSLYFKINYLLRSQKKTKITSLCFHRVTFESDPSYPPLQPHVFEGIIKYCVKYYEFILPSQVKFTTNKPKLILTFDDGYADFIENAYPILEKYKLPCIMSIVSDTVKTGKPFWTQRIGALINYAILTNSALDDPITNSLITPSVETAESISLLLFDKLIDLTTEQREKWLVEQEKGKDINYPEMLNDEQVQFLDKKGITFASHSKSHSYMPNEIKWGNIDFVKNELFESKTYIEKLLNKECNTFVAPSGFITKEVSEIAKNMGYKYLFSTKEDFATREEINQTNEIPRILMYRNDIAENIFRLEGLHKKLTS